MNYATSNNPLLTRALETSSVESGAMTFEGTADKTLLLLAVSVVGAASVVSLEIASAGVAIAALTGGLALAVATAVNARVARFTAVPWSFLQGALLGTVSVGLERSAHGVVGLAVALTSAALLTLLLAYRSRLIRPSARFSAGVVGATGAIAFVYVLDLVLESAGVRSILSSDVGGSGLFGIAVLALAVLNLVLDFDFIEQSVAKGAPKSMEWFAAFSLTVTLVWIYVQLLDLLGGED